MKKILSLFLFLGLFLFATTVRAEEVLINSFEDLKALEDVGGEAKLNADITMTNDVRVKQDLVLDLNGHTLNTNVGFTVICVSDVTFKDTSSAKTGKVTNGQLEGDYVQNTDWQSIQVGSNTSGKVTFESGTYEAKLIVHVASGELVINGGTFTQTVSPTSIPNGSKATFNGGTFNYTGEYQAFNVYGELTVTGGKITANNGSAAAVVWQDGAVVVNDGELTGRDFALSGNGSGEGSQNSGVRAKITVNGGKLSGKTAIYAPQIDGETKVTGGEITGSETALEIRAGKLTVTGGKFVSTADSETVTANGNGTTTVGAAIAVSQHTTKQPIEVNISGGEFTGYHPLVVVNPQNNTEEEISQVEVGVSEGTFTSTGDVTIVDIENNPRVTLTGGTYTHEQAVEVADGYTTIPAGDAGYAVVKVHYLNVKYLIDGNEEQEVSIIDPQSFPYGEGEAYEANELNAADVPEGYRLVRTEGNKKGTMGTSDVTVTFYYSNEYTLTLETNGGREIEAVTSTPDEGPAIELANFNERTSKEGYELAGWYIDEDLTKELTSWARNEDVTAYAKWTPIKYTIKYNLDGGEAENPTEYTIESEDIKLNNPEKEGFRFVDWKDEEDHALGMDVTIPKGSTGNKEFSAFYEVKQFKVTIGDKEIMADYGSSVDVTIDEYKLEKEGYEFLGYFYEDSPVENIIVREDVVLTPKFKYIYKMLSDPQTYVLNSNVEMVLKTNGEIDNLREVMVDGKALLAEQEVKITSGSTIATFIPSYLNTLSVGEHEVTFVYNDGELSATFNVAEDKEEAPKTGDDIMKSVCALICSTMTFGLSLGLRRKFN